MTHAAAVASTHSIRVGHRRGWRAALIAMAIVIGAILAIRIILPHYVLKYVNEVLNKGPGYSGQVDAVHLALWRGAYRIDNLKIFKREGRVPVPLFSAQQVDLSVQWREIFRGALVGEIECEKPVLNFVNGSSQAEVQSGKEQDWTKTVKALFPLRINRFGVNGGTVHYRDFSSDPKVDVAVENVEGEIRNLTNSEQLSQSLEAYADLLGTVERDARIEIVLQIDPYAKAPTFLLKANVTNLDIVHLNDLLRAYANVDAERGRFSVFAEVKAQRGVISGYVKPLIRDLSLLRWKTDSDHPIQMIWESIVAAVAEIFTNHHRDQIALVVPLGGEVDSPETETWSSLGSFFGNAFIRALKASFEGGDSADAAKE